MDFKAFLDTGSTIALGIIAVALVAVIVSRNANTAGVVQSGGTAFGSDLAVAEAPVTGNSAAPNLTYPGGTVGTYSSGLGVSPYMG